MISRPLTPPCVPFGTRRFFSFRRLLDNSQAWMYILTWLLFYSKRFGSRLSPFSNSLFYCWLIPWLSNPLNLVLSAFGTCFDFLPLFPLVRSDSASCPFVRFLEKFLHVCKSKIFYPSSHILLILLFSHFIAYPFVPVSKFSDSILHLCY